MSKPSSANSPHNARRLLKPLILITVVLVVPVALLVFWGEAFAGIISRWQANPPSRWILAAAVAGILSSDVFLPVPSGPLSVLAGSHLGILWGTAASTLGMTLGAVLAFVLARRWGLPLAERYTSAEQLADLEAACQQHGPWMVVLTRPLPILAEACALLVGTLQMGWRQFLPPLLISNLAISAGYAVMGQQAHQKGWLPLALCVTVAIPFLLTHWWRKKLAR